MSMIYKTDFWSYRIQDQDVELQEYLTELNGWEMGF